jgi:uncharacterized protein YlbG (UPF0298 family)
MIKRKPIVVYFRSPKALKQIENVANVTYYHKKRRYCICYVNEGELEEKIKTIKAMKLVKRVEESLIETDGYHIDFNVK